MGRLRPHVYDPRRFLGRLPSVRRRRAEALRWERPQAPAPFPRPLGRTSEPRPLPARSPWGTLCFRSAAVAAAFIRGLLFLSRVCFECISDLRLLRVDSRLGDSRYEPANAMGRITANAVAQSRPVDSVTAPRVRDRGHLTGSQAAARLSLVCGLISAGEGSLPSLLTWLSAGGHTQTCSCWPVAPQQRN